MSLVSICSVTNCYWNTCSRMFIMGFDRLIYNICYFLIYSQMHLLTVNKWKYVLHCVFLVHSQICKANNFKGKMVC